MSVCCRAQTPDLFFAQTGKTGVMPAIAFILKTVNAPCAPLRQSPAHHNNRALPVSVEVLAQSNIHQIPGVLIGL